ncbi:hypothetical protein XELAEV_18037461mg [Xenopus laevis]|uniref:Secreted protein n=1 Tax=Xenopus laevis TaxID=8355 RepID=A0A974CCC8_XENLA|nr:hypothetical protein XELAEV_18037461mg [Xenopus laevis]
MQGVIYQISVTLLLAVQQAWSRLYVTSEIKCIRPGEIKVSKGGVPCIAQHLAYNCSFPYQGNNGYQFELQHLALQKKTKTNQNDAESCS